MKTYFPLFLSIVALGVSVTLVFNKKTPPVPHFGTTITTTQNTTTAVATSSTEPAKDAEVHTQPYPQSDSDPDTILLTSKNTVSLRDEVNEMSMATLEQSLLDKSRKLKDDETLYLVQDTPGGSVPAGNQFIDFTNALPQRVKTINIFAASMGYHIAQSLDERLVLNSSTLMSHKATAGGIGGEVNGNLNTRVNFLVKEINSMDARVAKRLGQSLESYQKMIDKEYWVRGVDAVKEKSADRVVAIKCDSSLDGTYIQTFRLFVFTVDVTFSNCPAITGPLKIEIARDGVIRYSTDPKVIIQPDNSVEFDKVKKLTHVMFFDRKEYARQVMNGNSMRNFLQWID